MSQQTKALATTTPQSQQRPLSNVDPSFGYWFSGLFDGEGTFTIHKALDKRYGTFSISLAIALGLRDDDSEVVSLLKDTLGCGSCRPVTYKKVNHHPQLRWVVSKTEHLACIIIPLFDSYPLRTKKAKEYVYWKDAVLLKYENLNRKPIRSIDLQAYACLIEVIKDIRKYE